MKKINRSIAQLQAERKLTEQEVKAAVAKGDGGKLELKAAQASLDLIDMQIEAVERNDKAAVQLKAKAEAAVAAMEAAGLIPPQNSELKAKFMEKFTDPDVGEASIEAHAGESLKKQALQASGAAAPGAAPLAAVAPKVVPVAGALAASSSANMEQIGLQAGASYSYSMGNGYNNAEAIAGFGRLVARNAKLTVGKNDPEFGRNLATKSLLAVEAANWFNTHLKGNLEKWEHIPGIEMGRMVGGLMGLQAGDYNDPNGNLGTLSGTLVLQRTLPVFKYQYPELLSMYTDFSDSPGLYEQAERTRIVVQPAVQKFNATLDATGQPFGWNTVSQAVTTDVTITLTDYIAVPIAIGNNLIAATTRQLFSEQAVLAIAGIAGYFTTMLTNLLTAANYNYYAAVNSTLVPTAYTTYIRSIQTFGMSDLDTLDAIFTSSKVPENDRGILLAPQAYAKLRSDPRLEFFYAASSKGVGDASDFLTEAKLPKLSGFAPYKSGYLPSSTPATNPTTNNVIGFAYQKSGVLLKSRLPSDYTTVLGNTNVPGSITTVTDPDTKISMMLVQYVNLQQGCAVWRPEVMLGAAVADNRAGLVLTSQ